MSCCPEFTTWNGNYKYTNGVSSASVGVAKSLMIPVPTMLMIAPLASG